MSIETPLSITMSFPAVPELVSTIRLSVSSMASRIAFNVEDIEDIKIAVSEACTNVIQHAYPDSTPSNERLIHLAVDLTSEKIAITIQDKGEGFDTSILGTQTQKESSEDTLGLGLGLAFVQNLMDHSDIHSEINQGTTITMVKSLEKKENLQTVS